MKNKFKLTALERSWILYDIGNSAFILLLALLLTQTVAFPCSIIFGRLSTKYDTGLLIKVSIGCYTFITLFAVFLKFQWQFWMLAVLVGVVSTATAGMTWNIFGYELQNESMAVGTLVILFAIGYVLFSKADKLNKARNV